MPSPPSTDQLGRIDFSPGAEDWIEYGPPGARKRVGFHDYASLYAEPGLYERVFYEELGMRSAEEVVGLYAASLDGEAAAERVLDLGAGNGIGGDLLREAGVGSLVGLDLEPEARVAALRDRPGVYDDYVVADLATDPGAVAGFDFTAVVAVSAIGVGHIPMAVFADTLDALLEPGGRFAFAVADGLLPDFHDGLFARVPADVLGTSRYQHRRQMDGGDHPATAVVARKR
jgi:predicted TPR repeat methyltransferase